MVHLQKCDIEKAILKSKGMVSMVAQRLGVAWHTADKYIKKYELEYLLKDEKEGLLDFTESKLLENINANDTTSILFYLKTQGKDRGYIEKSNLDLTSGGKEIKQTIMFGGKEIEVE